MNQAERLGQTTTAGEPLAIQTFVTRILRSAALRADGELEILTDTTVVRGRPDDGNYVGDLWHRVREEIAEERHDADSRVPDAIGGGFIELKDVRVTPLTAPDREVHFDDLVLFTRDIRAIRSTQHPKMTS